MKYRVNDVEEVLDSSFEELLVIMTEIVKTSEDVDVASLTVETTDGVEFYECRLSCKVKRDGYWSRCKKWLKKK